ncbi:MAG: hypothetical protein ACFFCW_06365 [Candidatus Hodarchaeota archaeon]
MPQNYLRTDEKENSVDSLEMVARLAAEIKTTGKTGLWKWVIISLFNALYGFCICAIQGTDYHQVMKRDRKGKVTNKLISFPEALKRAQQDTWMRQYIDSRTLSLTRDQKDSIKRLREDLRNNFEHFTPKGWSIEVSGMPKIVSDTLDVIEFLALSSRNILWDSSLNQSRRIQTAIGSIRSYL